MKYLNMIARTLGAPSDAAAWVELCKKLGDKVKKGEKLMVCYTMSEHKLTMTKEFLDDRTPYEIK